MIALAVWVLLFVAVGSAAHFFGADSRDADYSARVEPRVVPRPAPAAARRTGATGPARRIG